MTEERKIMLVDDEQTLPFYVVEETKLNGVNYLLVTEGDEDEDGDCYILKDMSGAEDTEALYEFVEDEDELEGLMKIFEELLEDVDLERGVILEEIDMYEDTPEDLVAERLSAAVYKGTALARPILGRQSTLEGMSGPWLADWQRRHYHGGNMVASLAGNFTDGQVQQLTDLLAALKPGTPSRISPVTYRPAVTAKKKAIEQNHLILAFPAPNYLDQRRQQVTLLNALLGGGCSSRLFQQLREQRGLCYTVYSFVSDHEDTGLLGIYVGLNQEQERAALDLARAVVSDLADHGPTQEEVDRVREQAKANLLMGAESVQARMSHLGGSALLYGKIRETEELVELYDAVTRDQLRDLAGELFQMDRASLSAVGRVSPVGDYAAWLGR